MRDTELRLVVWRDGSTQAERLAAAILRVSGYEAVDPQMPIGGPDGGKDIICAKGGVIWTCAVYFPQTAVSFSAIKKKFNSDISKLQKTCVGFVFVTNRPLTATQRAVLEALAGASGKEIDIFHLERLRALLDSPRGYGVRLQFLHISMTAEDQLSWFSEADDRVMNAITINTRELVSIRGLVQGLAQDSAHIVRTMSRVGVVAPPTPDLLSTANFAAEISQNCISSKIDVPFILFTHRLTCFDMPMRSVGVLRKSPVWLADRSGKPARHLVPPSAEEVPERLEGLCRKWRNEYKHSNSNEIKLRHIAEFHVSILQIHPFMDGNGRVARAIMMQQCLDLFGVANMSLFEQGNSYYRALDLADGGDFRNIISLLSPVVNL